MVLWVSSKVFIFNNVMGDDVCINLEAQELDIGTLAVGNLVEQDWNEEADYWLDQD